METIGGFRLVRRLGSGARADVHLGRSLAGDEPRTVAVKVFRPSTGASSIDDEIEALARCSSRFLLRLEDLAMSGDGVPVPILGRVGPITLSSLALQRVSIGPGEAVTMLAPLAEAVGELHRVGVAHGNLRLDAVHLDDLGAPVLIGFGSARIIGPVPSADGASSLTPAQLDGSPAIEKDLDDLRAVARTIIESTPDSSARSSLIDWLVNGDDDAVTFCGALRERLFDFATPTAVRVQTPAAAGSSQARRSIAAPTPEPESAPVPRLLELLHLPSWLEDLVAGSRERLGAPHPGGRNDVEPRSSAPDLPLRSLTGRLRGFVAPVRRPVWITAGVIGALLVGAIAVVGVDDSGSAGAADDQGRTGGSVDTPESPPASAGASGLPVSKEDDPDAPAPIDPSAIDGTDPVAAVAALVTARNGCFAARSILCLDGVDQDSSAAMDADTHAIAAITGEEPGASSEREAADDADGIPDDQPDLTTGTPELTEELGGSAIVTIRFDQAPDAEVQVAVTVLVVRGDGGWRIRDLVFE